MKPWGVRFWEDHGDRLIFMAAAFVIAIALRILVPDLKGESNAVIVGVMMLLYNKSRSTPKQEESPPKP